ncbi:MAG: hypothetical protein GOU99_03690 [Candidatus Altiarchaeota archaeon]|nr:hypothetical protein [Candidatus Altiarchaeota archaeon]
MIKWILPIIAVLALLMIPMPDTTGLIKTELVQTQDSLLFLSDKGQLEIIVPQTVLSGNSDEYDFFAALSSDIDRFELLPTSFGMGCQVVLINGDKVSGQLNACLALAVRTDTTVYVESSLLKTVELPAPKNL